jgi:hypothetical protein
MSRGGKVPRGFVVGRLLDGFDKEKASSAAPGGRLLNERKIPAHPETIRENGIIAGSDAASLGRCPMSALHIFACVALIIALGYIGVSWAVAGVGLCVFATIALCWVVGR